MPEIREAAAPVPLKRNWAGAVALCSFFVAVAVVAVVASSGAVAMERRPPVIWFQVGVVLVSLACCWSPLKQMFTQIDEVGLSQPALLGRACIRWADVTSVGHEGHSLVVRSAVRKIRLNPFLLGRSQLISAIHQRTGMLS